jgi:signal transduction histidine kinase/ActR/RegA family two-component response regulator
LEVQPFFVSVVGLSEALFVKLSSIMSAASKYRFSIEFNQNLNNPSNQSDLIITNPKFVHDHQTFFEITSIPFVVLSNNDDEIDVSKYPLLLAVWGALDLEPKKPDLLVLPFLVRYLGIDNKRKNNPNGILLEALSAKIPEFVLIENIATGTIRFTNRSLFDFLGYREQHGLSLLELIHKDDQQKYIATEQKAVLYVSQSFSETVVRLCDANGEFQNYVVRFSMLPAARIKEPNLLSIILKKASEVDTLQVQLAQKEQEAKQAIVAKSRFMSNISHEVRTPLNAIKGLAEIMLSDERLSSEAEKLNSIGSAANQLLYLFNQVIDLISIETGKAQLELNVCNLFEFADRIKFTFFNKDRNKHINFLVVMDEALRGYYHADEKKLFQVVLHLINNAFKFTQKGNITFYSELLEEEEFFSKIRFGVRDTGIGIEESKHQLIFDHYFGSEDNNSTNRGTGIGLALSSKLVILMKGTIKLESAPEQGSHFYFDLKLERNYSKEKSENRKAVIKNLRNKCILVVEDNDLNQFVAKQILTNWDAQVDLANNGREALDMLAVKNYDLVLMDLQMPIMDGIEATTVIRSGSQEGINKDIPIVALTADALFETKQKVLSFGINDFVTKPFEQDVLYRAVAAQLF